MKGGEVKMAIPFSVVPRVNPSDRTQPERFFVSTRISGELTLRDLAGRISGMSTVTTIDTMAVLEAFLQVIPEELANGRIVRLGDFGSLRVLLRSEGSDNAEDFSSSLINQVRMVLRPGRLVRNTLNTASLTKVE